MGGTEIEGTPTEQDCLSSKELSPRSQSFGRGVEALATGRCSWIHLLVRPGISGGPGDISEGGHIVIASRGILRAADSPEHHVAVGTIPQRAEGSLLLPGKSTVEYAQGAVKE